MASAEAAFGSSSTNSPLPPRFMLAALVMAARTGALATLASSSRLRTVLSRYSRTTVAAIARDIPTKTPIAVACMVCGA